MSDEEAKPSVAKSHGRLSISASLKPRDLMDETPRLKGAWVAKVVTLFPEAFPGTLGLSLTGKALAEGRWALETIDLRPFGEGKHRNVDDNPAGGGAGMVLRADVVAKARTRRPSARRRTGRAGLSSTCRRAGGRSIRRQRVGWRRRMA